MVQAETSPEALVAVFDDLLKLRQASALTNEEPEYGPGLEEASVMILKLRALLRSKCEETEELREQTAAARSTLDQSSLKLKNLAYENDHYSKEIHACLSFQSAYDEAQLELLPLDEFERIWGAEEGLDAHQVMKNRLTHERVFRTETVQQLEALRAERDALAAEVAQRRSALGALEGEVSSLLARARSVAQRHGVAAAQRLPGPLFVAYELAREQARSTGDGHVSVEAHPSGSTAAPPFVAVRLVRQGDTASGFDLVSEGAGVTVRPQGPRGAALVQHLSEVADGAGDPAQGDDACSPGWARRLAGLDLFADLFATLSPKAVESVLEQCRAEGRAASLVQALLTAPAPPDETGEASMEE